MQTPWRIALVCAAAVAGAFLAYHSHPPAASPLMLGTLISPRRALPDFNLIDQRGQAFGPAQLRGHWSIMFFGYTHCPDFCPATLAQLAAFERKRRSERRSVLPTVLFVSVDAKRDTPAQLAQYVPYFDPTFIGLTAADEPTVQAFAAQLGLAAIITPEKDGGYSVDHSTAVLVVDPSGDLAAILTGPLTLDGLENDFDRILAARA